MGQGYKIVSRKIRSFTTPYDLDSKNGAQIVNELFSIKVDEWERSEKRRIDEDNLFLMDKLECAFSRLKIGKAAGPDRISVECLNAIVETCSPMFLGVLNKCLMEQCFPSEWKRANVVLIHKGGVEGRFRTICLKSVLDKILEHVIKVRVDVEVERQEACPRYNSVSGRAGQL